MPLLTLLRLSDKLRCVPSKTGKQEWRAHVHLLGVKADGVGQDSQAHPSAVHLLHRSQAHHYQGASPAHLSREGRPDGGA